jgi:hypothetical protein
MTLDGDRNLTQIDNIHGSISGHSSSPVNRPGIRTYTLDADTNRTTILENENAPKLTLRIAVVKNTTKFGQQ